MYEHDCMVYREDRVGSEVTSSLFFQISCPGINDERGETSKKGLRGSRRERMRGNETPASRLSQRGGVKLRFGPIKPVDS